MTLTGRDPFDPTPGDFRELIFGAGTGSTGVSRDVVIYGNKISTASETLDTLSKIPIADDEDAIRRFGRRSEWRGMYRVYKSIDPNATIYGVAISPSAGIAAFCLFTVANVSNNTTDVKVEINGQTGYMTINDGDAIATTSAALNTLINSMDDGNLQVTSISAIVGGGPTYACTVTASQLGLRGDHLIGDTASRGARVTLSTKTGTQAQTITKSAITHGTLDDDASAALTSASNSERYYHVFPFHTTNTGGAVTLGSATLISLTDNQLGEAVLMINTQANPSNGKGQQAFFGLVGSSAEATLAANDAQLNSVRAKFMWKENCDLTPAQLAAANAAVHRLAETAHPAANVTGWTHSDAKPFPIPDSFVAADVPTATEIRTALNGGYFPVAQRPNGGSYIVRSITNRWMNADNIVDYKAREGHITSAIDFSWEYIKGLWQAQKQPFVADDLKSGQVPMKGVTYPSNVKAMIQGAIAELAGPKPLGLYDGPILAPDKVAQMQKSVVVTKITAGISVQAELFAVEHLLKFEAKFLEVGASY